eukprot:CAMPEP_0114579124 /NCGR_PEP_ID=MMETSP0125-20121206/3565_1 /TAXON_ID=485358 ORGANISM="Aristerostoma sp., Strain ATCC 50986" /NCGR_SAMPLE_ID=MMETSP0125 /ASSEMBLY_ACC=CAM_ASM_000245 /LENGTH=72 /DNA_ID=CAMNT_0001769683 /DNA_START=1273 /DNA_END=1491 /DNA_ORIENTATION=+
MITECEAQLNAFLRGFRTIIPLNYLGAISPSELSFAISGPVEIDVKQMKETCLYDGYKSDSEVAIWFWEVVE